MQGQISSVIFANAAERWRVLNIESSTRRLSQLNGRENGAVVGEANESLIKGGVPKRRQ
jgi:hypothetical protein